jgi:hypothetical protein
VFHGCLQYAGLVGDAVTRRADYNEWADTNQIIGLYPQTTKDGHASQSERMFRLVGPQRSASAERGFRAQDRFSSSSIGPFTKVNSSLVQGASFADQDPSLSESTTYYYQVKAVHQLGTESGPSSTMARATTA